jgi:hypothetical protein
MKSLCLPWKKRTPFFCMVTHRDHIVKINMQVFVYEIGRVVGDIDTIFLHGSDRARIYAMGFDASTVNLGTITGKKPQVSLGHLASTTVAGAKDKNFFHT